ncbi:hypothetical protein L2089_13740 [Paenibacillus hunanensis]|uniref:hypothetical protein n=1 Tax=Paenibacillus hunanensis TaxID=539262 RepID=UPI0020271BE5|nr:hypothetical protein [Paenibacillus hunanensis]MCL9661758.1 hypothetical protein [Paenibacillus hunanensis]
MEKISVEHLMELYINTLEKCGKYLLEEQDELIEYNIFEEFDTGVISFLHKDSLKRLHKAGLINNDIVQKSTHLRELVLNMQKGDEWNIHSVKSSPEWMRIFNLTDEIREEVKQS